MKPEYLLMGIDIGTTSVKCLVMNSKGEIKISSSHNYPIFTPHPTWVEQNPEDWWSSVIKVVRDCLQIVDTQYIVAISLSGHMSALVMVNQDGNPVGRSILIADTRSAKQTSYLRKHFMKPITAVTGNQPLDAFTVSKLLWIKEEAPEQYYHTKKFIFPKDYIRFKLTGRLGTEPTDAGNSLLYDRVKGDWNWELIGHLGLRPDLFPELAKTTEVFGYVSKDAASLTGLRPGIPVISGGADMACSQIGTGAIYEEVMAITLSTSAQVVMSVPDVKEQGIGRVTFHPGVLPDSLYAMGSIFTGGLGVDWGYRFLFNKSQMKAKDYIKLEKLTKKMQDIEPGSGGLLFLPFLVGSGTPYFDTSDRASWLGLSLSQDKSLLLRSILEGISYNIRENAEVFEKMNIHVSRVHIGGGGSKNKVWCQIIADVLGKDLQLLEHKDASPIGAAILAGVGVEMFASLEDAVNTVIRVKETIKYNEERHEKYQHLYIDYKEIYQALNRYYHSLDKQSK